MRLRFFNMQGFLFADTKDLEHANLGRQQDNSFFRSKKKILFYILLCTCLQACNPMVRPEKENFIAIYDHEKVVLDKFPPNTRWLGFAKQEYFPLKQLQAFTKLERLQLSSPKYNNFLELQQLTNLKTLNISGTSISQIQSIPRLAINKLILSSTSIQNLRGIEKFAGLTHLELNHTNIQSIAPLEALYRIKHLYIQHTAISDIQALKNSKNLYNLYLKGSKVSDLNPIMDLPELTFLEITGLDIPKEQIEKLQKKLPYLAIIR
ncbi:MAG: hypothetical protein AAF518_02085 [Spirochaetota bacterium]